jgi:hypothetical protein
LKHRGEEAFQKRNTWVQLLKTGLWIKSERLFAGGLLIGIGMNFAWIKILIYEHVKNSTNIDKIYYAVQQ